MAIIQFPGTDFHDLNLDWVLQQVKNLLTEWASTKEEWETLKGSNEAFVSFITAQWDDFKTYVENYLANLPLTEEVSAKIDAMVNDGTLLELITHDDGEGSALSDVAGQWLAAHITQETGYVIDDSLTVQGAAADAKATGDAIDELKNVIKNTVFGDTLTFTGITSGHSFSFPFPIVKDGVYKFTNNTTNTMALYGTDENNTPTLIHQPVSAGETYTFVAPKNFVLIGGYFNGSGSITVQAEIGLFNQPSILSRLTSIETNETTNINKLNTIIGLNEITLSQSDWEQGGIAAGGIETVDNARIRTKDYISSQFGLTITVQSGYSFVIVWYDENKNFISGTYWNTGTKTLNAPTNTYYFRAIISKGTGSPDAITTDDYDKISLSYYIANISEKLFDTKTENMLGGYNLYNGEKFPDKVSSNRYTINNLFEMDYDGNIATSQDIDIYNDKLFVAFSGTSGIKVYDLNTKQLLAAIDVNTIHGSGMQFSNDFYAESDTYPLLYVGGWTSNLINVIRILNSDNTWTATIVKTLYIPTSYGYYFAPSIDIDNNIMYCLGYESQPFDTPGNKMILLKCDLSNMTSNDNTYTPDILNEIEMPNNGIMQGRKYLNGRIYIAFSNTTTPRNNKLCAINPFNGDIVTTIKLGGTYSELEGLAYQKNGNNLTWYLTDYFTVAKIDFKN